MTLRHFQPWRSTHVVSVAVFPAAKIVSGHRATEWSFLLPLLSQHHVFWAENSRTLTRCHSSTDHLLRGGVWAVAADAAVLVGPFDAAAAFRTVCCGRCCACCSLCCCCCCSCCCGSCAGCWCPCSSCGCGPCHLFLLQLRLPLLISAASVQFAAAAVALAALPAPMTHFHSSTFSTGCRR